MIQSSGNDTIQNYIFVGEKSFYLIYYIVSFQLHSARSLPI
jgi:hypothetical protein